MDRSKPDDETGDVINNSDVKNEQRRRKTRRRKKQRTTTTPASQNYQYDNYASYYDGAGGDRAAATNRVLYLFLPLIVLAISGAVCYYFTRVACKLCMQQFSVSLPLTIVTPLTAAIFCYLCHLQNWSRIT